MHLEVYSVRSWVQTSCVPGLYSRDVIPCRKSFVHSLPQTKLLCPKGLCGSTNTDMEQNIHLPAAHSHLEGWGWGAVGAVGIVCQHTYIVYNLSFFAFNYQMPNFIQSSSRSRPFMHHSTSWPLAVCLYCCPFFGLILAQIQNSKAVLNSQISDKATSNFTDTGPQVTKAKAGCNLWKKKKNYLLYEFYQS